MSTCYLCTREGFANCTQCYKTICRAHAEEVKGKTIKEETICTSCKKKRKMKRIQLYTIIGFIILLVAIIVGVVFSSINIWG